MKRCEQKPECQNLATAEMFWPGSPPRLVCKDHEEKALNVARCMGFHLHTAVYIDPEDMLR